MSKIPLTQAQLLEQCPALFTSAPHASASDAYHFVSTVEVIDEIRQHGWFPVSAQEASVRDEDKAGFQRHLVRFRHFDDLVNPKENAVELLLFNSHDRSTAFSISVGIYRFVCANGLVVADSIFKSYKIKHIGDRENDVTTAIANIGTFKPLLQKKIDTFEAIILTPIEQESFAKAAIPLRFDEQLQVNHRDLLIPHRVEDERPDLYTTLNIIQENLLRGNVSGVNKESGRRFSSRAITSISKDVDVNQGLWDIAERIASIKEPHMLLAA